jgi:hypothetical protein
VKKPRIYLDTSVIGGCFDAEFAPWSNGLMQDFRIGTMLPVLSTVLAAEIEDAPRQVQGQFAELLTLGPELVHPNEEAYELADLYQQHGILTPKYYDNGLHIALATVAVVDLLVSWNFRHIVRYDKIRLFNAVNLEQGYKTIQIHTPREVTNYGPERDQGS